MAASQLSISENPHSGAVAATSLLLTVLLDSFAGLAWAHSPLQEKIFISIILLC